MRRSTTDGRRASWGRPRRRGVATIEFALVLPLLMFIALLVIFFGKAMLYKQNVLLADRQLGWRQAKVDLGNDPQDATHVRQTYFRDLPVDVRTTGGWAGPIESGQPSNWADEAENLLVIATTNKNREAGDFASRTLLHHFPSAFRDETANVRHEVQTGFPVESIPLAQFGNEIMDKYYREGSPWHRRFPQDVSLWGPLQDKFIQDVDNLLSASGGDDLRRMVRRFYTLNW